MKHLADISDRKSLIAASHAFEHWMPKVNFIRIKDIPLRCSKALYKDHQRLATTYLRQWILSTQKQDLGHARAWERQPEHRKLSYLVEDLNYIAKIYTLMMISSPVNIDPDYITRAARPRLGNVISDWTIRAHQFDLLKAIGRIPDEMTIMRPQSPFDLTVWNVMQDKGSKLQLARTLGGSYTEIIERISDYILRMEFAKYITESNYNNLLIEE